MSFMSIDRAPKVSFTSEGRLLLKCEIQHIDIEKALKIFDDRANISSIVLPSEKYNNALLILGIGPKNASFMPTVNSVRVYVMNRGIVADILLRVGSQVDTIWLMNRAPIGSKLVCQYSGHRVVLDRKSGGWFFGDGKKACKASFGINDAEFAWIVATAERMQSPVLG